MNLQSAKDLIKQNPGKFYVYFLKRPNGIPFYVGKGNCKGFRIEAHGLDASSNRGANKFKNNTIKKIWEEGNQIDYEIVLFTDLEEVAFDKEIELINFYGRKSQGGILTNLTDGGEGLAGYNHSKESKSKMSKMKKGKSNGREGTHLSEETRHKISKANKGQIPWTKSKNHSIEHCHKISKAKIGHSVSEETRHKISLACKGKVYSEELERKCLRLKKVIQPQMKQKENCRSAIWGRNTNPFQKILRIK